MCATIQDDNLRLVLASTERGYIEEKRSYHRTSLLYCGLILMGLFFYLELLPLLLLLLPNSDGLLMLIGGLWSFIGFCTTLMAIPIWLQVRKYENFMQEHQKFMRKYNR